jgi:hypothetical protein
LATESQRKDCSRPCVSVPPWPVRVTC